MVWQFSLTYRIEVKMTVYPNKVYNTIVMRLRRAGFSKNGVYPYFHNSGGIASFLYELYTQNNGVVYKSQLISHKIMGMDDGLTNDFLKCLVKTNFIKWDMSENQKKNLKPYQTFASHKLADLLDKHLHEQKATKKDLAIIEASVENELTTNYISFSDFSKYIRLLIEVFNPPYSSDTHKRWCSLIIAEHQTKIESLKNKKKLEELPF